jgi:hypothetical protein
VGFGLSYGFWKWKSDLRKNELKRLIRNGKVFFGKGLENFEKIESSYRERLKALGVGVGIDVTGLGIEIFVCFDNVEVRDITALKNKKTIDRDDAGGEMPKVSETPSIKNPGWNPYTESPKHGIKNPSIGDIDDSGLDMLPFTDLDNAQDERLNTWPDTKLFVRAAKKISYVASPDLPPDDPPGRPSIFSDKSPQMRSDSKKGKSPQNKKASP